MEFHQTLLILAILMSCLTRHLGVVAGSVSGSRKKVDIIYVRALVASPIECGSFLNGSSLLPCISTVDPPASISSSKFVATELPIGGAGIGPTPFFGTVTTSTPIATQTFIVAKTSTVVPPPITLTATPPATTVTQTVSEIILVTTGTGSCFGTKASALASCTTAIPAPTATTSKSAAIPVVMNPIKFIAPLVMFKKLFYQSLRVTGRRIGRRSPTEECPMNIFMLTMASVLTLAFFIHTVHVIRKWKFYAEYSKWTMTQSVLLISTSALFYILAFSNLGRC